MGASDSEEGNEDNVEHSSLTKVFSRSLCQVFKLKLLWGLSFFLLLSFYLKEDWEERFVFEMCSLRLTWRLTVGEGGLRLLRSH